MRWNTLVLLAVSCGGSKPVPATVADGCYDLAVVLCDREASCGVLTGTLDECRSAAIGTCCHGAFCEMPVAQCGPGLVLCCKPPNCQTALTATVFDNCEAGIEQLSCGQLATGAVPTGCIPDAGQ